VPTESVVKGYEYEKNRFVEIDLEELKNAAAQTSSEIAIQEFVKLADIDPVYFETSYYISPEAAGEKAYALLYRSMQETAWLRLHNLRCRTGNMWWCFDPARKVCSRTPCSMRRKCGRVTNTAPTQAP
jgi:DNA end-binding protein Ku